MNKTIKPAFIMNCIDVDNYNTIRYNYIYAKASAKLPISTKELNEVERMTAEDIEKINSLAEQAVGILSNVADNICQAIEKKAQPWYKRLWNKLKYAFTW